jgi:TonB family protein
MTAMQVRGAARRIWGARAPALVSIAFHGALLLLVLRVVTTHVVPREPPRVELTAVTVIEPATQPAPGNTEGASDSPGAGAGGAPGAMAFSPHNTGTPTARAARSRSQTRAPAAADPRADILVSYDAPRGDDPGDEGHGDGSGQGAGLAGDGAGAGYGERGTGYGMGGLRMPDPPPALPSLARPPVPKHDYSRGGRWVKAGTVLLMLTIDPHGVVRNVQILRGADYDLDVHARETARRFEFYPALDRDGGPIWSLHRWEFVVSQEHEWSRWPDARFPPPPAPR